MKGTARGLILTTLLLISSQLITADLNDGGVLWYNFTEGTLIDYYGNQDLTNDGATATNNMYDFERGDPDKMSAPFNSKYIITDAFTVCVKLIPESVSGASYVFSRGNYGGGGQRAITLSYEGLVRIRINEGAGDAYSTSSIVAGVSYHLCGVYNKSGTGQRLQVYINGTDDTNTSASDNPTDAVWAGIEGILIGTNIVAGSFVDGTLDEIRLWNRSLTPSEIYSVANNPFLNLSFYDEISKLQITQTVEVDLISDDYSNNYSTTSGYLNFTELPPGFYAIQYGAVGYSNRFHYIDIPHDTYNNYTPTLYLINNSYYTNITFTIRDQTDRDLPDAYIVATKHYVDTNSYETVEIAKTGLDGKANMNIELFDAFYKFYAYYPFGTLQFTSTEGHLIDTEYTFRINTGDDLLEDWYNELGIDADVSFNNDTNNFKFQYSDSNGVATNYCLDVFIKTGQGYALQNNTCLTTTPGSILINVIPINGTSYMAIGSVIIEGNQYDIATVIYKYPSTYLWGTYGLFVVLLITVALIFISKKSLELSLVLAPVPLLLFSGSGVIQFPVEVALILQVAGVVGAVVIHKK